MFGNLFQYLLICFSHFVVVGFPFPIFRLSQPNSQSQERPDPFSTAGRSEGIFIYCVLTIIIYSISTRDCTGIGVTVWRTKAVKINLNRCPWNLKVKWETQSLKNHLMAWLRLSSLQPACTKWFDKIYESIHFKFGNKPRSLLLCSFSAQWRFVWLMQTRLPLWATGWKE